MYLEKRRRKWYALHDIPPGLRAAFGGKKRFAKSLETENQQEAKRRAAGWEHRWRQALAQARDDVCDPAERDGEYWRRMLASCTSDFERDILSDQLADELDAKLERIARQQGYQGDPRDLPEAEDAVRTYKIATGELIKTSEHVEEWLTTKDHLKPKTLEMYRSDLARLAKRFPYITDITKPDITGWITKDLLQGEGLNRKTLDRLLPACRGYWRYLQDLGKVPNDVEPFSNLSVQQNGAKSVRPRDKRKDYSPEEVFQLLEGADAKDAPLADLIRLGMWTGARIGELCQLRVEHVRLDDPLPHFSIEDSKTAAGVRTVPIHPELEATLARLIQASSRLGDSDGYLIPGLTPNKFGDRSNAIGKRFGRLKTELGFTGQHGFHSFRHTVITRLLNAGMSSPIVASIVGHETGESVTLSVYHKGFSLEVQRQAILGLTYPMQGR
jgi:integrase